MDASKPTVLTTYKKAVTQTPFNYSVIRTRHYQMASSVCRSTFVGLVGVEPTRLSALVPHTINGYIAWAMS